MKKDPPQHPPSSELGRCPSDKHDWEFYDNFPGHEIFECRRCKLRKFVDLQTGKETYEQAV